MARVGGTELSIFGTPPMVMRQNIIRLTALVLLIATNALAPVAADAQALNPLQSVGEPMTEPAPSPLADNYAWEKNVVGRDEPALVGPAVAAQSSGEVSSKKAAEDPAAL